MKYKEKLVAALMVCGANVPFSVSADQVSERIARHEFNLGTTASPIDFDPLHVRTYTQKLILKSVYQTLVRTTADHSLAGDLAIWEIDWKKKAYVFHLDPKAKFQNGQPVLAEDVAWSIARHFWPGSYSPAKSLLKSLASDTSKVKKGEIPKAITILDTHTIRFSVKGFSASFLHNLSSAFFSIVPHQYFNPLKPISSGPMNAIQDEKTGRWSLVRNPDYAGPKTKISKITIVPFYSLKEMKDLFDKSEIDLLTNADAFSDSLAPPGFEIRKIPSGRATHLFFNTNKSFFREKAFRRDLSSLIQKEMLKLSQKSFKYKLLHTCIPEGVLPSSYYEHQPVVALTPEAFKTKWKNKKGSIVILSLMGQVDENIQKLMTNTLNKIGLKTRWEYFDFKKKRNPINQSQYDLFFTKMNNILFPYSGVYALQEYFNGVNIYPDSLKSLAQNMKAASSIRNDVNRYNAYAKAFQGFESEYQFIPLLQASDYPFLARKELKVEIIDDQPVIWKSSW